MLPDYSVAIRTLGKAGESYQRLLNSLETQIHKPTDIFVYLAKGYDTPHETIGKEKIVYVEKGMVAQRALDYDEINTEWILFLDDDVELEPDCMSRIFSLINEYNADVIAFDSFPRNKISFWTKMKMALLLSSLPHFYLKTKGYRISCFGSLLYNICPKSEAAWSTTNAGPGFLCKKSNFKGINFKEELWLDKSGYAFPEDAIMFYKMHLKGLKILTWYNPPFRHLDAQTTLKDTDSVNKKTLKQIRHNSHNQYIFYHKYIYPSLSWPKKILGMSFRVLSTSITLFVIYTTRKNGFEVVKAMLQGRDEAQKFLINKNNIKNGEE